MKLAQKEIKFIDNWLQFAGIGYLDVRYELVDHLVLEFEQQTEETNLETFVRDRLNWCKFTAIEKEKSMHWGVQKAVWKQAVKIVLNVKVILPILIYVAAVLVSKDQLSARTSFLLLLAPFLATFVVLHGRYVLKGFKKELREKVLAIMKLGTLSAWPHMALSLTSLLLNGLNGHLNTNLLALFVILATVVNLATINVYDLLYDRILKDYRTINGSLV